ncbi:hypothetical protein EGR_11060 [Echinococcus granulosus]|uniref:Uncharacterized protein n=1 Tax=Echinococcus granulosus TaxID=6210 RepID=W6U6U6_ECHGR|nr:hypothetical protein EGR_11060 [Echinococcus granulosus]EUB54082.1 hypothetical protein EGR_11060 [Echinococcus granulosus]
MSFHHLTDFDVTCTINIIINITLVTPSPYFPLLKKAHFSKWLPQVVESESTQQSPMMEPLLTDGMASQWQSPSSLSPSLFSYSNYHR